MTEPANSFQTLLPEHVLRRREKGEASFLYSKSPGREEASVTNRGRGMEGEKEAKRNKGKKKR